MINTFILLLLAGVGALMAFTLWRALSTQSFQGKRGFEISKEQHPFWYWFNVLAAGFALMVIVIAFFIVVLVLKL